MSSNLPESDGNAARAPSSSDSIARRDGKPDVRAIMAEIRARVRADVERHRDAQKPFPHLAADFNAATRRAGELVNSEELRFLNLNHSYPQRLNPESITTHRRGPVAKLLVRIKRKIQSVLWHQILKDYFTAEKEFQANLVRFLNDMSKYVDARDAANFWELIRKIDVDVSKAMERIERVADEQTATTLAAEKRIHQALGEMQGTLARLGQQLPRIDVLENVTAGLEGIMARLKPSPGAAAPPAAHYETIDYSYLLLENRYRGSEDEIARRVGIYPQIFKAAPGPVLEIGCGRGELQALFKAANVNSYGVDLDQAMVQAAREKGLDARLENGLTHLESLSDASLGGVVAIQVVEHLTHAQLTQLMRLAVKKIKKGGRVVFETINPRSLTALSSNYFRDPTHVFPLHPDTLAYDMQLAGMRVLETRLLSPVPEEATLKLIPIEEHLSARWIDTVQTINRNLTQLNHLLFGHQDYCVIAEVG